MRSEMIKFFLSSAVPCGFVDSEGEFQMNLTMSDLLSSMIFSVEMKILIEKVYSEKAAFSLMCNLPANFRKSPTVWQFHFLPLFCSENGYLGTFFHAHEFLFLSPLDYVDGIQPYTVTTEKPNKLFTAKEWQILFFMMQRLSLKEIARRLDIGTRTARFGKSKGFDRYIPYNFVSSRRTAFERGA
ncbi:helix-turn-helix transcriptional regulator [Arsenophonus nasoniae]|uniref:helix-turn-helix transcriptional regulator n=1 Tax=Arsenophonus nasoniae TaxID=638 RepID=UPI00387A4C06